MARALETIKTEIKTQVRTYPSLNDFKFPEEGGSVVSVFNLIIDVVSMAIYTFEVLIDKSKLDLQAIADTAPSGNLKWLREQIMKFQYGDVITLVNYVPTYPVIDLTKRIVTRCSTKTLSGGGVSIKVAKGTSPSLAPLTTPEMNALKDYYFGTSLTQGIGFPVKATFISLNPDRMMVQATVYFYGQYVEATVKTNVIAAINSFFQTFQDDAFDGTVYIIKLTDAIQAVEGVSRISYTSIKAREALVAYGSAVTVDTQGYYVTMAGYLIPEDTATFTLNDTLTMAQEG